LEVNSMNARKPALISPITPSTRAVMSSGRCALNALTASIHAPSIRHHSRNEPSWPPHTPEMR
jgi:hypothetical protein